MRLRLALLALGAAALAVAVLAPPGTTTAPPATSADRFEQTRRLLLGADQPEFVLHRVEVSSYCPGLVVEWSSTNLEPTTAGTLTVVELRVDGSAVTHGRAGGGEGVYEDGPARVVWHGTPGPGSHVVEAVLRSGDRPSSNWGVPYLDAGRPGLDTLVAWPVGEPGGPACARR